MILQRLNMDTSWLIELSGITIVVDPWLEGVEIDYFRWFNTQWHRTPPLPYADIPAHDAVLITQKYADHCHELTLRRLQPAVVLAPRSVEKQLRRWLPDATLMLFEPSHRQHQLGALTITQLRTRRRMDPIYDAFVIEDGHQRLMMANHGFSLDAAHIEQMASQPRCDVLVSPLNRYRLPAFLGGVVTPGLDGLRPLVEQVQPRWVIQTHDEDKHARGLIPKLAKVDIFDVKQLADLPWLRERYQPMNHYKRCQL